MLAGSRVAEACAPIKIVCPGLEVLPPGCRRGVVVVFWRVCYSGVGMVVIVGW